MTTEFLVEFFSEEIPARMQPGARAQLGKIAQQFLADAHLPYDTLQTYSTPRRLTLVIDGLPEKQPARTIERKGPKVGAPPAAVEGFLKSCHLSANDLIEEDIPGKGLFYFARIEEKGATTASLLTELIEKILSTFSWPKSMRWGDADFKWVRPLHHILALYNGQVVPVQPPHPYVTVGNTTEGHRFLASTPFEVQNFATYEAGLRQAYVILSSEERQQIIQAGFQEIAAQQGALVAEYPGLLEEVSDMVEWPVPLSGQIDPDHMTLPREILVTSMRHHQKYTPLVSADGDLLPFFLFASNSLGVRDQQTIIDGNERVLRARLEDASFYWEKDLKTPLDTWNQTLKNQLFHQKLGSVHDKVQRLQEIARTLSPGSETLEMAALYCKADLASGVVGEFPELQGIMGGYYAQHHGLTHEAASAIRTHYLPQGPEDPCPLDETNALLALIDKVDTLVGFFAVGIIPTGSKDPFALRRAALGILRIIFENALTIDFTALVRVAYNALLVPKRPFHEVEHDLIQFMCERLKNYFKGQGFQPDHVAAVVNPDHWQGNLLLTWTMVQALSEFATTPMGAALTTNYKRAANIVRQAQGFTPSTTLEGVNQSLFDSPEEAHLHGALKHLTHTIQGIADAETPNVQLLFEEVATLTPILDAFFDKVTVNHQDSSIQENRLQLLAVLQTQLMQFADFSKIEKQ